MPFMFLIASVVILLAIFYLAQRVAWVTTVSPFICGIVLFIAFLFSFVLTFMARLPFMEHCILHGISFVAGYLFGFLFCLLVACLSVDIIHLFVHLSSRTWGISAFSVALILAIWGMGFSMQPKIKHITLPIANSTQPTTIVHLTDIHLGQMRGKRNLQTIVDKTNAQTPDIVVITGDLYDASYNLNSETLAPLRELKAPVYFVEGNHDIYVDSPRIKQLLREVGVRVLENEVVIEHGIQLIGLDYLRADEHTPDKMHVPTKPETIQSVLNRLPIDTALPTVALHHNPIGAEYFAQHGVDLYLAGHTHGGQFYPLIWINDIGFQYNRGLYKHDDMYVYVSPGTGATAMPLRLGEPAEITVITLE